MYGYFFNKIFYSFGAGPFHSLTACHNSLSHLEELNHGSRNEDVYNRNNIPDMDDQDRRI